MSFTRNSLIFKQDIVFNNVSFRYGGEKSPLVLKSINLTIRYNKVTAIVGESGSGKTTLLRLLLKTIQSYKR
jgi:ATP-binding cassette subfamily B protein